MNEITLETAILAAFWLVVAANASLLGILIKRIGHRKILSWYCFTEGCPDRVGLYSIFCLEHGDPVLAKAQKEWLRPIVRLERDTLHDELNAELAKWQKIVFGAMGLPESALKQDEHVNRATADAMGGRFWSIDCKSKFKAGDWVRLNAPGMRDHGKLHLVKEVREVYGELLIWCITEADQVMYSAWPINKFEFALPRKGEWWRHRKGDTGKPFKLEYDHTRPCSGPDGCMVPVNFGKGEGEYSSDPQTKGVPPFDDSREGLRSTLIVDSIDSFPALSKFKPGDWARRTFGEQLLGRITSEYTPSWWNTPSLRKGRTGYRYQIDDKPPEDVLHWDWDEHLEPALPREGEWWKDTNRACALRHSEVYAPLGFKVTESDAGNSGVIAGAKCGCLVPANFGRGE